MKTFSKILIGFFLISLLVNFFQWKYTKILVDKIHRKDKAITEIRNSIKIIAQGNNSIDFIYNALQKDFYIDEGIKKSKIDSSYYFTIIPKNWNTIDNKEIWGFYGLEVVFDKEQKFKQIDFYKP